MRVHIDVRCIEKRAELWVRTHGLEQVDDYLSLHILLNRTITIVELLLPLVR